jgi:hypothetical protein
MVKLRLKFKHNEEISRKVYSIYSRISFIFLIGESIDEIERIDTFNGRCVAKSHKILSYFREKK